MSVKLATVRGNDYGAINVYEKDDSTGVDLGPTYRVPAMQGFELEILGEDDELFGDEEKKDVYALFTGVKASCKHGQIDLETLALMIGSTLEELGASPNQSTKITVQPKNPPWLRFRHYSAYAGESGGANTQELVKCKVTSLTIKAVAKGYAEIEFSLTGKQAVFPHPITAFLHLEARETGAVPGDDLVYLPHRQILPIWAPDAAQAFTGRTTDADVIQQRAYHSSTVGDYVEWTRSLGAGSNTLTFFAQTGPDRGAVEVLLDGTLVTSVDLYAASAGDNYKAQVAMTVATSGSHAVRLRIGTKNASSSGDLVAISSVEVTHGGSAPVDASNVLPTPAQSVYQISAFQWSATSGTPSVVDPGTNAGEKISLSGLGAYIEYEIPVEEGTYSLKAVMGKGSSYGSLTFSVEGSTVGVVDGYAASTATPDVEAVPGTFVVAKRSQIKIRLTVATKNASSTGYDLLLAWIGVYRASATSEFQQGESAPSGLEMLPWHAENSTGWAGAAGTNIRNWAYTSDGVANRILGWTKTLIGKGTWRARLAANIVASGATLELHHGGGKVAEFDLNGTPNVDGRLESVFTTTVAKLSELELKNPSTTVATVYYLWLENLVESKSLGTIFLTGAAQHHIPDHRAGDAWPGLSYAFTFNSVPADFTGDTVTFTVYQGSLSGPAVLTLTDSSGLTVSGDTITVDPFTPTLTAGTYHYDLKVTSGGSTTTYVYGTWTII